MHQTRCLRQGLRQRALRGWQHTNSRSASEQRRRTLPNICLACSCPPPEPSTVRPLVSMRCGGGIQTHRVQVRTPHNQLGRQHNT